MMEQNPAMNAEKKKKENKDKNISVGRKLSYGIGAIGNGTTAGIIGFFIQNFMIFQLGIDNSQFAIIQGLTQVTNAITDPLIGVISDRTRTRFGRRRPFFLAASLTMPLFYVLLFSDFGIQDRTSKLIVYLLIFIMFYVSQTIFNVPHMALLIDLSDKESVRNSFAAYSSAFFALGNLIGPLSLLFLRKSDTEKDVNRIYTIHAAAVGVIIFASILTVFFGVKSTDDPVEKKSLKDILGDYVSIMKYKSYRNLTIFYICSQIAVQTLQFNLISYTIHVLQMPEVIKLIMPIALISSVLAIFPLVFLVNKIGKKKTYLMGMILFLPVFFTILIETPRKNPRLVLSILGVFSGIGTGTAFYISSAMLPDIIVEDYLMTGQRREGAFSSFYVFLQKIAISLSHALTSKIIYWAGGIDPEREVQTESVQNAIRYCIACIPIGFVFLSFFSLYFYPLTKKKVKQNQLEYLKLKRK